MVLSSSAKAALRLIAGIIVAVALAACGSSKSAPPNTHSAGTPIGNEAVMMAVPTDAGDVTLGGGFTAFETAVENRATDGCLAADGLPAAIPIPIAPAIDNLTFPNLVAIARGVWTPPPVAAVKDPTRAMGSSERKAYAAGLARCEKHTVTLLRSLNTDVDGLAAAWSSVVADVDSEPRIQAGLSTRFAACSKRAGVTVANPQAFLAHVDQVTIPLEVKHRTQEATAQKVRLGRIYQRCLGPTEALRSTLLAQRRAPFLSNHFAMVRKIDSEAAATLAVLGKRYHVKVQP